MTNQSQQSVTFSDGNKMPLVGLGTWLSTNPEDLEGALEEALNTGYRHIDTAYVYQNEKLIGNILKRWLDQGKVKREELFIVTKLPPIGMNAERVGHFLQKSLENLQLDYVDLYLIHTPVGLNYQGDDVLGPVRPDGKGDLDLTVDLEKIWGAMETQVDAKRTRSIGLSNFNPEQIERICKVSRIKPANLQVEMNVYFQQKDILKACKENDITICAFAPFGSPGRKKMQMKKMTCLPVLEDPAVLEIATRLNKTPGQILLRFLVQQNIVVIPKSVTPERIRNNFQVFDFELSSEDFSKLQSLDKGKAGRTFLMNAVEGMQDHPEYPYKNEIQ